ncbi:CBS domain-containing protein [Leptolyngbya sp. PCC 6406]|uniref:CBS domain-containing protein n=1 Tax=Leptolyngbya sp. PCC 6406 TaxID=1173264 RepID=UPI0002AC6002|nr:CBS domain-containing protein [Leptolyngbya sp. PCC 6406]
MGRAIAHPATKTVSGTVAKAEATVVDVMTTTVQMINRDASVAMAIAQMQDYGVRSLIVERPSDQTPYGIITERDIVYRVFARGLDPQRVRVHDIMRQPCIAMEPSLSLQAAAQIFADTGIQRAPVIQSNTLLGIVSVTDLVMKSGSPFASLELPPELLLAP